MTNDQKLKQVCLSLKKYFVTQHQVHKIICISNQNALGISLQRSCTLILNQGKITLRMYQLHSMQLEANFLDPVNAMIHLCIVLIFHQSSVAKKIKQNIQIFQKQIIVFQTTEVLFYSPILQVICTPCRTCYMIVLSDISQGCIHRGERCDRGRT